MTALGYVRVPPDDDGATPGIDWRETVHTREELRQLDDANGTARLVLQGTQAYVKTGKTWWPFAAAGAPGPFPPPVHLSAVDRLAELVNAPAQPE